MAKQRLRITVPYPESSLNMGNPDTLNEFGWAGITQKTDKHFFVGVAEQGLFQAGGTVVFQTEDNWHQYAAEMAHAAEGRLHLGSGEAMILFAGGGQGSDEADAFGEDVAGSSPATNSYNKIDLMAAVQTQAAHVKTFLGTLTSVTEELGPGFLARVEQLEIDLGHLAGKQKGPETELCQVIPQDTPGTSLADRIASALEKLEEKANELAGIESEHDMYTRFNPYTGPTGIADFTADWTRKMRGILSDNALTKAGGALFEVGASAKTVRDEWNGMVQSGKVDAYAQSVGSAARAQGAFEEEEDETQATLQTSDGPWDLSGDGPYELKVKVDGGAEVLAGTITANCATIASAAVRSTPDYTGTLVICVDGGPAQTIELANHTSAAALAAIQSGLGSEGTAKLTESAPARIQLESGKRGTGAQIQIVSDSSGLFGPGSATGVGSNVVDGSAVTAAEVKAALTMPEGSEVVDSGDALLFRSQKQGEGSRIELSSGLAASLDVEGADEIASDDLGELDTMTTRQSAVLGYLDPLIGAILDPVDHIVAVAGSVGGVAESVVEVGSTLDRLVRGGEDDPVPLALLASGGITLGTENRIYGAASKGFYFVADGGTGQLGTGMVPTMLKAYATASGFLNRTKDAASLLSLGFRVRSDSDVDLKADFFGSLTAVDGKGLVRIESGGATDITAATNVAIGPRKKDAQMEVFGDQILVGVRADDEVGIGIKDREFKRPDSSPQSASPTTTQKAWPTTTQKPTQNIALSAEKTVQIEAGDYLVEVGSEGVRIGRRLQSAPATAAVAPSTPAKRATLAIDTTKPMLKVHDDAVTIESKAGTLNLEIKADGTLTLLGKASSKITLGDSVAEIGVGEVKVTAETAGMTINGGGKLELKGKNVVKLWGGAIKLG